MSDLYGKFAHIQQSFELWGPILLVVCLLFFGWLLFFKVLL